MSTTDSKVTDDAKATYECLEPAACGAQPQQTLDSMFSQFSSLTSKDREALAHKQQEREYGGSNATVTGCGDEKVYGDDADDAGLLELPGVATPTGTVVQQSASTEEKPAEGDAEPQGVSSMNFAQMAAAAATDEKPNYSADRDEAISKVLKQHFLEQKQVAEQVDSARTAAEAAVAEARAATTTTTAANKTGVPLATTVVREPPAATTSGPSQMTVLPDDDDDLLEEIDLSEHKEVSTSILTCTTPTGGKKSNGGGSGGNGNDDDEVVAPRPGDVQFDNFTDDLSENDDGTAAAPKATTFATGADSDTSDDDERGRPNVIRSEADNFMSLHNPEATAEDASGDSGVGCILRRVPLGGTAAQPIPMPGANPLGSFEVKALTAKQQDAKAAAMVEVEKSFREYAKQKAKDAEALATGSQTEKSGLEKRSIHEQKEERSDEEWVEECQAFDLDDGFDYENAVANAKKPRNPYEV